MLENRPWPLCKGAFAWEHGGFNENGSQWNLQHLQFKVSKVRLSTCHQNTWPNIAQRCWYRAGADPIGTFFGLSWPFRRFLFDGRMNRNQTEFFWHYRTTVSTSTKSIKILCFFRQQTDWILFLWLVYNVQAPKQCAKVTTGVSDMSNFPQPLALSKSCWNISRDIVPSNKLCNFSRSGCFQMPETTIWHFGWPFSVHVGKQPLLPGHQVSQLQDLGREAEQKLFFLSCPVSMCVLGLHSEAHGGAKISHWSLNAVLVVIVTVFVNSCYCSMISDLHHNQICQNYYFFQGI